MMTKSLPVFALSLLLSGCVANANSTPPPTETSKTDSAACVAAGAWYDPGAKRALSANQFVDKMRDKDIVLLGETHVFADHHRWQAQTIAQLHAQRPDLILGFEAFPRRVQPALDRWVAGELSEKEFLKQSEWETVWKYDASQYMPLFQFARLNRVPMVALNVDRALIREVSAKGWKGVPQDLRRGVGDPAPATPGYLTMLGKAYSSHSNNTGHENGAPKGPELSDPMFSNFVDVQLTWDRAMAEAADTALKTARAQGRAPRLVAIIGRGHMDHFYGVPTQLSALGQNNVAVLTPWDLKLRTCSDLVAKDGTPAADAVFGIAHTADMMGPDKPKLGVLIDSTDAGVRVAKVVENSIGEAAGLKKDDLIIEAAGIKLTNSGALVTIIKSMAPGTWLPLNIRRADKDLQLIARFPADAPTQQMHGPK